jgi:hypothetical protein
MFYSDNRPNLVVNNSVTIKSHSAVVHFPVDSNSTLTQPNRLIETGNREIEAGMLVI